MDELESVFHQISDEEIYNEISSSIVIQDYHEVTAATPQFTTKDVINAFELGKQWLEKIVHLTTKVYF